MFFTGCQLCSYCYCVLVTDQCISVFHRVPAVQLLFDVSMFLFAQGASYVVGNARILQQPVLYQTAFTHSVSRQTPVGYELRLEPTPLIQTANKYLTCLVPVSVSSLIQAAIWANILIICLCDDIRILKTKIMQLTKMKRQTYQC